MEFKKSAKIVWYQSIITLAKMIKKAYSERIKAFLQEYMKRINEYLKYNDLKSVSDLNNKCFVVMILGASSDYYYLKIHKMIKY